MEPPPYSEQGQPRGRKPKKGKTDKNKAKKKTDKKKNDKKKRTQAKKGQTRGKSQKSLKSVPKHSEEDMEEEHQTDDEVVTPPEQPEASKKPKRPRKAQDETTWHVPDDCVPAPPGIPTNLIYSKAYTVQKKCGGEIQDWQRAGKHASWLLRVKGLVSPALSGPAVYNPKKSRHAKDAPGVSGDAKKPQEGKVEEKDDDFEY